MMVYLLWGSDTEYKWVDGVYADKTKAEADMRILNDRDKNCGWFYTIQEKEVTK
jgi:hypothetical protein